MNVVIEVQWMNLTMRAGGGGGGFGASDNDGAIFWGK